MMQFDLDNMNLRSLCDLLVLKTTEFIVLLDQRNADGYKIRDLKLEVEKIQETINVKKSENGLSLQYN
jgi:hypothetical protein